MKKCKHSWTKFFMFGIWWYICLLCGKIPDNDKETQQAKKQVMKKSRNESRILKCSEVQFWEEFIPHAIKTGILTKKEADSLKDSLYNYFELIAEKFQAKENQEKINE